MKMVTGLPVQATSNSALQEVSILEDFILADLAVLEEEKLISVKRLGE